MNIAHLFAPSPFSLPSIATPTACMSAVDVANVVSRYAITIGCDDSNIAAAVAYGLRTGHDTLSAIRSGKKRAEQLAARQPSPLDPFAA